MFSYTGVEKKQNNKNGEDQKPNLTLDVMKMSAVVIRGYRQKHVPPSQKKKWMFWDQSQLWLFSWTLYGFMLVKSLRLLDYERD